MPANAKYLTPGFWPRFSKITASILGSYLVTVSFYQMLVAWFDTEDMLITMAYTGFLVWVALMIVTFIARSGWKMWGLYLLLTGFFALMTYLGIAFNS